jgi:hypothetical protein
LPALRIVIATSLIGEWESGKPNLTRAAHTVNVSGKPLSGLERKY